MTLCPTDEVLRHWLDESLPSADAETAKAHIDGCEACQGRLAELTDQMENAKWPELVQSMSPLCGRIQFNDFLQLGPSAEFGAYELIDVISHGGMSVVYRARQPSLDRIVAIKMILAGRHADAEQLRRFNTEALALARLQHPNIVQIFEVGEHDGLPFIAMEFVAGRSLDKEISGVPQNPRWSAETVRTLAIAVQAAHECGVIHRDLKPANVLLSDAKVAKISDFGIAKLKENDGQTGTSEVMGTPSYMAPEQAKGSKNVATSADIYGLGAILYELLTGVPPFQGAPLEILMRIQEEEPPLPRTLNDQVDPDLEAICLQCLEKKPPCRYESAKALADDLQKWLAGEPIAAERRGSIRRRLQTIKNWPRRRWVTALAVALSIVALLAAAATIANWPRVNWHHDEPKVLQLFGDWRLTLWRGDKLGVITATEIVGDVRKAVLSHDELGEFESVGTTFVNLDVSDQSAGAKGRIEGEFRSTKLQNSLVQKAPSLWASLKGQVCFDENQPFIKPTYCEIHLLERELHAYLIGTLRDTRIPDQRINEFVMMKDLQLGVLKPRMKFGGPWIDFQTDVRATGKIEFKALAFEAPFAAEADVVCRCYFDLEKGDKLTDQKLRLKFDPSILDLRKLELYNTSFNVDSDANQKMLKQHIKPELLRLTSSISVFSQVEPAFRSLFEKVIVTKLSIDSDPPNGEWITVRIEFGSAKNR